MECRRLIAVTRLSSDTRSRWGTRRILLTYPSNDLRPEGAHAHGQPAAPDMNRPADLDELIATMRRAAGDLQSTILLGWLPRLRHMARRHLPTNSPLRQGLDSEDLLQEGLLHLVRHVESFRGATWPEFLAFVHTVLAQKAGQQARRAKVRHRENTSQGDAAELPAQHPSPSVDAMAGEDRSRLRDLVAGLPEPYRTTMQLRIDGIEPDAIAARLEITGDALRQRLSRAVRMLKDRWS